MKNRIPTVTELQKIRLRDNSERMIAPSRNEGAIVYDYRRKNTGIQKVLLRESVEVLLNRVQDRIKLKNADVHLLVVEGYRSPEDQERYYLQQFNQLKTNYPEMTLGKLLEQVHQLIAQPSVAGHPTGGAVDLTLSAKGCEVPMGGKIADFSRPELLPTFSSKVTSEQAYWRCLLHDAMVEEGFAPFYGEWWHFSFGDREWAAFYGHPESLFAPVYV